MPPVTVTGISPGISPYGSDHHGLISSRERPALAFASKTAVDARNVRKAQGAFAAGYRVRVMRVEDAVRVAEIHVRTWREAYVALLPADYLAGLDVGSFTTTWRERLVGQHPPGLKQLVGVDPSGDIVAIASAGPTRDEDVGGRWELWMINVLASEQGTGLADLMMGELIGDRPASLWVLDGNVRARAFYTRYGFEADSAAKQHPATGTIEVRLVRS